LSFWAVSHQVLVEEEEARLELGFREMQIGID
jgi:hypothetical protein